MQQGAPATPLKPRCSHMAQPATIPVAPPPVLLTASRLLAFAQDATFCCARPTSPARCLVALPSSSQHAHGHKPTVAAPPSRALTGGGTAPRPGQLTCHVVRCAAHSVRVCCVRVLRGGGGGGGGGAAAFACGVLGSAAPARSMARRPASPCYITILLAWARAASGTVVRETVPPSPERVTPERYRGQRPGRGRASPGARAARDRALPLIRIPETPPRPPRGVGNERAPQLVNTLTHIISHETYHPYSVLYPPWEERGGGGRGGCW